MATLRAQMQDLAAQLEIYKTAEHALRSQLVHSGGKDAADAVYIDALKSQIRDHTATQSALQITAKNFKDKAEKATKKLTRAEEKLDARDRFVERLKGLLEREKNARYVTAVLP